MSIFKESEWETDDTGDKLAKELFVSKKKIKSVKAKDSGKKFKGNDKKRSGIVRPEGGGDNETNNKKRKSSAIEIDDIMIKKWKSESMSQSVVKKGLKSVEKEASNKRKTIKDFVDRERERKDKKTDETKEISKKKQNLESKKKSAKFDGGIKSKSIIPETDLKGENSPTKSQKRRLKQKAKLLKKDEENLEDKSRDVTASKKIDKSKLKIDRLQRLLAAKQESTKNGGDASGQKSLRDRMLARLKSSRFRYLNEQMYNSESWSSKKYFKEDPDAFFAYHEGYKLQVDQWPLNPLDTVIASIRKLSKDYVIADFGCGEGRLAESVPHKVHSLDLVAVNDKVTACDMAHTSLLTGRIDVVVFCLSLMGTNLIDYIIEANRVLRKDGILKIAEVESRFENVDDFVKTLASYGFVNTWKDLSHNLFYFMDFKKNTDITKKRNKLPPLELKSCLYKRR